MDAAKGVAGGDVSAAALAAAELNAGQSVRRGAAASAAGAAATCSGIELLQWK